MNKKILCTLIIALAVLWSCSYAQVTPAFGHIANFSTPNVTHSVKFSPDGKMIAYAAEVSGFYLVNSTDYTTIWSNNVDFVNGGLSYAITFAPDQSKVFYSTLKLNDQSTRVVTLANNGISLSPNITSSILYSSNLDVSYDSKRFIRCSRTMGL